MKKKPPDWMFWVLLATLSADLTALFTVYYGTPILWITAITNWTWLIFLWLAVIYTWGWNNGRKG